MGISERPTIEVFKEPIVKTILAENSNMVMGEFPGVAVGVEMDGETVWRKDVYSVFIGPQTLLNIPRPRFAQRIASAERKAEKIASELR